MINVPGHLFETNMGKFAELFSSIVRRGVKAEDIAQQRGRGRGNRCDLVLSVKDMSEQALIVYALSGQKIFYGIGGNQSYRVVVTNQNGMHIGSSELMEARQRATNALSNISLPVKRAHWTPRPQWQNSDASVPRVAYKRQRVSSDSNHNTATESNSRSSTDRSMSSTESDDNEDSFEDGQCLDEQERTNSVVSDSEDKLHSPGQSDTMSDS